MPERLENSFQQSADGERRGLGGGEEAKPKLCSCVLHNLKSDES